MEFEKLVIWLERERTKGRKFEESTLSFLTGMTYDLSELSNSLRIDLCIMAVKEPEKMAIKAN